MTLQQMRYFIAVAQNLSFSKAAQQHYVSQTAVSQQIKLLEEELETELFQRTRHSVALTSAGQVFYEYAHHRPCGGCRPPHPRRCRRVQHPA